MGIFYKNNEKPALLSTNSAKTPEPRRRNKRLGSVRDNESITDKKVEPLPVDENGQLLPQVFPGYQVTRRLAERPHGEVYAATDQRLARQVALHCLRIHPDAADDAATLFFNTARGVARLRQDQLVRGVDVGRIREMTKKKSEPGWSDLDGMLFFTTLWVEGETLRQRLARLERKRILERDTYTIVYSITQALAILFSLGMAHLSLHTGNIVMRPKEDRNSREQAVLLDVGLAREIAYSDFHSLWLAHPDCAAPEQIRGDFNIDIRADFYALGCIWVHLLTGQPLFTHSAAKDTIEAHLTAELPATWLTHDNSPLTLHPTTDYLLRQLLSKDRTKRPRSPQALLALLEQHPGFAEFLKEQQREAIVEQRLDERGEGEL